MTREPIDFNKVVVKTPHTKIKPKRVDKKNNLNSTVDSIKKTSYNKLKSIFNFMKEVK